MAEVTIRDARRTDRPSLVGFMAALQDFERGIEANRRPGTGIADGHLAALEAWVAERPGGGILVAEIDGRLAGFIVFGVDEEFGDYVLPRNRLVGQLSDLWVQPRARGRGVAGALILAAEARLRAAGIGRTELAVLCGNPSARRVYEALGYAPYQITLAKQI